MSGYSWFLSAWFCRARPRWRPGRLLQWTMRRGAVLIRRGLSPRDVVSEVSHGDFDPTHAQQQHGVAVLGHAPAGYTGSSNPNWAGDVQGADVSAQGNILAGARVISAALSAFERSRKIPAFDAGGLLVDRLGGRVCVWRRPPLRQPNSVLGIPRCLQSNRFGPARRYSYLFPITVKVVKTRSNGCAFCTTQTGSRRRNLFPSAWVSPSDLFQPVP